MFIMFINYVYERYMLERRTELSRLAYEGHARKVMKGMPSFQRACS